MMKILNKKYLAGILSVFVFVFIFALPVISFGQTTVPDPVVETPTSGTLQNPIQADNVIELIKTLLEGIIKIGMPIIALMLVYSGFLFVFARGNSEKLKTAKNAFIYTVLGAAILLGSWAIAQLISETVLQL